MNHQKVVCYTLKGGYEYDEEIAKKYLEIGREYTVEKIVVHNWSTEIWLKEIPNVMFNSVFFDDI